MSIDAPTIVSLWSQRARESAEKTGMLVKREGKYEPVTWGEIRRDVNRVAAALKGLGVQPGDRVVMVSRNRYEWIVCDLAHSAGPRPSMCRCTRRWPAPKSLIRLPTAGRLAVILSGPDQAEKLVDQAAKFSKSVQIRLARSLPPVGRPLPGLAAGGPHPAH